MLAALLACTLLWFLPGCGFSAHDETTGKTFVTTSSRVPTLDPAHAATAASCTMVGHLYDRLVEYDYLARPYELKAGAADLPQVSADGLTYTFRLRDDLFLPPDPCFASTGDATAEQPRHRLTAHDAVFSLLRLADARVRSSGYWTVRGNIVGLDEFRAATGTADDDDYALYDAGIEGLEAVDDRTLVIRLRQPYPRLLHVLAMPYASLVPEAAIRHYGARLAEHPVGSGPFLLGEWRRNYRLILKRNPDHRRDAHPVAGLPMPLVERVVCLIVQEPLTAWLLFLQGNLDVTTLTDDNYESALQHGIDLNPGLAARGVRLVRSPQFQINYVAFNARDPVLGVNVELRRAISLAYDVGARVEMSNHQLVPAHGPIPPGVGGHDETFRNPYAVHDPDRAREALARAGYPGGVDPVTGEPLTLHFDLGRSDLIGRQMAEMMIHDMAQVGIRIVPRLNSWPRFLEKIRQGDVQLFRIAWIGDYPDGQNFLQLFHGPNAGSSNRAFYRNPEFDRLYESAVNLPDTAERRELYRHMQELLVEDCPWIFESHPIVTRLQQAWVRHDQPHHFAYDQWKYIDVDTAQRDSARARFRPVRLQPPKPMPHHAPRDVARQ